MRLAYLVCCVSGVVVGQALFAPSAIAAEPDRYTAAAEPVTAADVYGQGVRETPWLSPSDEAKGFHLPPGFVAELVAAEPQIAKPLNMAFDHRGRLWVTCTVEYPYPAPDGRVPRDSIRILEDTDGDGLFEKVTIFAEALNIPIGLIPVEGGAICFSIPNIWMLKDTDGDDRADERIKLLGPFDTTRDTHGMISSLRRGSDGWIYACHGYNNRSIVTAADGSKVELTSGNTFRFRDDGSRIEQYTHGQVNPFGMCSDEWGNWYTADCHSKPLTELLAGASYPSFSRPHDGLGFAPSMMDHLHESTAICGLEYYKSNEFPAPFRHLFLSGNVMTSRINCDALERNGATVRAKELGDFMTSDDPWFRPVDIRQGPDGALYVADFYNKIIGHYEVPLQHPGRDRESGRIWRIRYVGDIATQSKPVTKPLSSADLSSTNSVRRQLAIEHELVVKQSSLSSLRNQVVDSRNSLEARQSALEILVRRGELDMDIRQNLLSNAPVQIQTQVLRSINGWVRPEKDSANAVSAAFKLASSDNPEVAKAAIEVVGRWGSPEYLPRLIELAGSIPAEDPVKLLASRIAMRAILQRNPQTIEAWSHKWAGDKPSVNGVDSKMVANILPGVSNSAAAKALLQYVATAGNECDPALRTAAIEHATKHPDAALLDLLVTTVQQSSHSLLDRAKLVEQIANLLPAHTRLESKSLSQLAAHVLADLRGLVSEKLASEGGSVQWIEKSGKVWALEPRKCNDGQAVELLSSLTLGERYVGVLESEPVACPAELKFWLAGHNGPPDSADHRRNFVALIDANSGTQIAQAFPPRNDTAFEITWDLKEHLNKPVRLRIVDGDDGTAYAWLGIARVSLPQLQFGTIAGPLESMAGLLRLGFDGVGTEQLLAMSLSTQQRANLQAAWLDGQGAQLPSTLIKQALMLGRSDILSSHDFPPQLTLDQAIPIAKELCLSATGAQQSSLAQAFLRSEKGCEILAEVLSAGWLNPAALRGASTILPATLAANRKEQLSKFFEDAEASGLDTALVANRLSKLDWHAADATRGKLLFGQHCANCHQLAGQGAVIGPQLDGAVHRSFERLAEDVLLPNLNVDKSFRSTIVLLEDGTIITGLIREETADKLQLVGSDAKTVSIDLADVAQRKDSNQSLMPANLGDLLNDAQFADLLQFLRSSAVKP